MAREPSTSRNSWVSRQADRLSRPVQKARLSMQCQGVAGLKHFCTGESRERVVHKESPSSGVRVGFQACLRNAVPWRQEKKESHEPAMAVLVLKQECVGETVPVLL